MFVLLNFLGGTCCFPSDTLSWLWAAPYAERRRLGLKLVWSDRLIIPVSHLLLSSLIPCAFDGRLYRKVSPCLVTVNEVEKKGGRTGCTKNIADRN